MSRCAAGGCSALRRKTTTNRCPRLGLAPFAARLATVTRFGLESRVPALLVRPVQVVADPGECWQGGCRCSSIRRRRRPAWARAREHRVFNQHLLVVLVRVVERKCWQLHVRDERDEKKSAQRPRAVGVKICTSPQSLWLNFIGTSKISCKGRNV